MARTLVLCKPDAVERGLVGEIVHRLERRGLRLVAAELTQVDPETARSLYGEHEGKPFYDGLMALITRAPVMAVVVDGPEGTHGLVRGIMGATDPGQAAPGSIRGDLGLALPDNLVHGSDSPASAEREIALFFPGL